MKSDKKGLRVAYNYLLTEKRRVEDRLKTESYSWDIEKVQEHLVNIENKIEAMQISYSEYLI